MDIDPFLPLGIDLTTARFLDAFLLYCALEDSPTMSCDACRESTGNFALTVKEGRRPGLALGQDGQPRELARWGQELLDRMAPCAALLDAAHGTEAHRQALGAQRAKLQDPELTPSARVLNTMREDKLSFCAFALRESERHAAWFRGRPLEAATRQAFEQAARDSMARQARELATWGLELLEHLAPCAALLDAAHGTDAHRQALDAQRGRLQDPNLTPSARVLNSMREDKLSFCAFALRESERHAAWFRGRPLDAATRQAFEQAARDSMVRQALLEQEQQGDFADYVARYMAAIGPR